MKRFDWKNASIFQLWERLAAAINNDIYRFKSWLQATATPVRQDGDIWFAGDIQSKLQKKHGGPGFLKQNK